MTPETRALTQRIAKALNEPNVELIEKVVEVVGPQKAAKIFAKAAKLYKSGVKTLDGSRKRTPGGCFFYVAKGVLRRKQRFQVGLYFGGELKALEALQEQGYSREEATQYLANKAQELTKAEHKKLVRHLAGEETDEEKVSIAEEA
jgi:hypothetical protein